MNTINVGLALALFGAINCFAVIMAGSSANTNRPINGCGWDSVGSFRGGAGVVIGTNTFVTAGHVTGEPGDIFNIDGAQYPVVSTTTNTNGYLRVCTVQGTFPRERISRIYTNNNELGKEMTIISHGPIRGQIITSVSNAPTAPIMITCLKKDGVNVKLDITGGDAGRQFRIQWSTNLMQWGDEPGLYTSPSNTSVTINLSQKNASGVYYRTMVTDTSIITNGWLYSWSHNASKAWGKNNVDGFKSLSGTYNLIYADFKGTDGPIESTVGPGDSGGGAFVLDNGEWKLAGIIEGTVTGPYSRHDGTFLGWGGMQDVSGLTYLKLTEDKLYVPYIEYPFEGGPRPIKATFSRISYYNNWLLQFTN